MREYCKIAQEYGNSKAPVTSKLKKVLVVLNPAANKRNAEDNFNNFCAPILNLGGYMIDVVKTQSELHAIRLFEEEINESYDAIILAGGDGLISESITGIMRRDEGINDDVSIGVLPLGQYNEFSLTLLNSNARIKNKVEEVKAMAQATLAILKENRSKRDLMKIELISDDQENKKIFFATGSIFLGSFNDIFKKREKYWFTGSLRNYTSFLFNGLFPREQITWNCDSKLIYSQPCSGCSNCYEKIESKSQKLSKNRWWSKFNAKDKQMIPEYSKILNPKCLETAEIDIRDSSEIAITTNTIEAQNNNNNDVSKLNIKFNSKSNDYGFDYVWNSWKRVSNREFKNIPNSTNISARQLTLLPANDKEEIFFSIDNNPFEVRPIKVTILPKRLDFFVL